MDNKGCESRIGKCRASLYQVVHLVDGRTTALRLRAESYQIERCRQTLYDRQRALGGTSGSDVIGCAETFDQGFIATTDVANRTWPVRKTYSVPSIPPPNGEGHASNHQCLFER